MENFNSRVSAHNNVQGDLALQPRQFWSSDWPFERNAGRGDKTTKLSNSRTTGITDDTHPTTWGTPIVSTLKPGDQSDRYRDLREPSASCIASF